MPGATRKREAKPAAITGESVALVSGFALVRVKPRKSTVPVRPEDSATVLVAKIGKALKKPGIDKSVVFRGNKTGVFSYSAYPGDPDKVVREAVDGTRRVGRLVKGRFVAAKAA